jgi:uncharacterized protein (DUF924 family)/uncharacterized protein (DUF952 family)
VTIYHLTTGAEAARAAASGEYVPAGFEDEGFIHCSYSHQLTAVADARFRGRRDLVVLAIDRVALACEVVDENLEGGTERFPHVYGRLPTAAIVGTYDFPCRGDGAFELPPALESDEVLRFWFPRDLATADHARMVRQLEWWFRGGTDATIAERFGRLHERAARGELDRWSAAPRSRLALIVVLDQFSRSLHRGTARAFAQDPKALALALDGIASGHYGALATPWEKTFFFMPLGHSEDLASQERAVALAAELVAQAPPELRRILEHSASQARGHRDVVARFGRHPHRNAVLGRRSTPAELDYLAQEQLVHTRRPPA